MKAMKTEATSVRVFSAIVIILAVIVCFYLGRSYSYLFIFLFGALALHEVMVNFFGEMKWSIRYFLGQIIFLSSMFYFVVYSVGDSGLIWTLINLLLNAILVVYLFYDGNFLVNSVNKISKNYSFLSAALITLPCIGLVQIFQMESWRSLLGGLLILTYGMDTGAWLFGRTLGRHKLMERVSPKKTVEGFLGGLLLSGVLSSIYWNFFDHKLGVGELVVLVALGGVSQIGDLIESKFKRQFNLKDSSALIPGHGGVYDRIDSLIFVTPFYVVYLQFWFLR